MEEEGENMTEENEEEEENLEWFAYQCLCKRDRYNKYKVHE